MQWYFCSGNFEGRLQSHTVGFSLFKIVVSLGTHILRIIYKRLPLYDILACTDNLFLRTLQSTDPHAENYLLHFELAHQQYQRTIQEIRRTLDPGSLRKSASST